MLCVALFALFAFGAVVSSAFAIQWLVEGKEITAAEGPLRAETEGKVLFVRWENETLAKVLEEVECAGIFVREIGPGGTGKINEVQNLIQEKIGKDLEGLGLSCSTTFDGGAATDCEVGSITLLWPANLPWATELELMEVGGAEDWLDKILGEPGYEIECKVLAGLFFSELCVSPLDRASMLVENFAGTPGSVLGWFLPEHEDLDFCGVGLEHVAEVVSDTSSDTWAATGLVTRLATSVSHP
jgi:hypothetical protein